MELDVNEDVAFGLSILTLLEKKNSIWWLGTGLKHGSWFKLDYAGPELVSYELV